MGFFANWTWPKVAFFTVVALILTRVFAPEAAEWILRPIIDLTQLVVDAFRTNPGQP